MREFLQPALRSRRLSFVLEPHHLVKILPGIRMAGCETEGLLEFSDSGIELIFLAECYAQADVGFDEGWIQAQRFAVRAPTFPLVVFFQESERRPGGGSLRSRLQAHSSMRICFLSA